MDVGQSVKVTSLDWRGHLIDEKPDPGEPELHSELLLGKVGIIKDHDSWVDETEGILDVWLVHFEDAWSDVGYDDWWFLTSQLELA